MNSRVSPENGATRSVRVLPGSAAWNWYSYAPSDNLTDNAGRLSSYGQQVAGWIASASA